MEKLVSYGSPFVPQFTLKETVTYDDTSVYSYETAPESNLVTDEFMLPNTITNVEGFLSSIELYGHVAGEVEITVINLIN